jgi:actin-like ATPase involved in cell morphogenesis
MSDGATSSNYVVGIDLGTTYSAAAVAHAAGRADIVGLGHVTAVIPSSVLVRADGEILVGDAAERRAASEPTRVAREFKRRLGDPVPLVLGGTPYGPEALTAHLLRHVYGTVVEQQGGPPSSVVITHPANYGEYKLDLLREAVRLADVPGVQLLTEPEAAASHYAQQDRLEPGDVVAVYDFGGGTFDAAVLRVIDGGFELIGTPEGMERLGGIDFDQAVYAHVVDALGGVIDEFGTDPAVMAGLARLRDDCREAKEALSSDTDADVPVALPNVHTDVRITRSEFEAMIRPRIAETIDSLGRAVRSAGLSMDDVTKVLLVGGSSRIPLVAEMVRTATGRPVAIDAHPKHAIAAGAALHGASDLAPATSPVFAAPSAATADGAVVGAAAVGPGDAERAGDRRKRFAVVGGVVAALALIAVGATFALRSDTDGTTSDAPVASDTTASTDPAGTRASGPAATEPTTSTSPPDDVIVTAGEVILEPLTAAGDAVFTDSVAAEPSTELLAFVRTGGALVEPDGDPATDGGPTALVSRVGTEPGVYGGTQDEQVCDAEQLVTVLAAERPAEGAAWAGVHEIEVGEISDYVDGLTALALTSDTRVTNHGFVDGEAVPRQSVLQVGTAVMVDDRGVPRVRCSSGSPLLPPEPVEGTTTYRGQAWDTFAPSSTAAIVPADDPTVEFVVFDVASGEEFIRPVGSTGASDRALLPGEILATGGFTAFPEYSGPFDVNVIEFVFSPTGGPVTGTFMYAITVEGFTISGEGTFEGTYDVVSQTIAGTADGVASVGGFAENADDGVWAATVDPLAGVLSGTAGDETGGATFELTFSPFSPPAPG